LKGKSYGDDYKLVVVSSVDVYFFVFKYGGKNNEKI